MNSEFIAHHRKNDGEVQTVYEHLNGVSCICGHLTAKIGLPDVGKLLGLLHDIGKYSHDFQIYIKSATNLLNPDIDDEFVDSSGLKGKIDHSTAGAQWIWRNFGNLGLQGRMIAQILAVCLSSHHGGLIDCLHVDGTNGFQKRISKEDAKSHLQECMNQCEKELMATLDGTDSKRFLTEVWCKIVSIVEPNKSEADRLKHFRVGFFTRFLFSCLIDADRMDSADFENPINKKRRSTG